jgi:hypothetical protein
MLLLSLCIFSPIKAYFLPTHGNGIVLVLGNDNSIEANEIKDYKHQVIKNYEGNWQRFFLDFRNENSR